MSQEISRLPRLVVAAPQGRSGKTTVTLGLCAAFKARGLTVQPYKKGPDYIDPSWLSEAAGRACRSLDPFFYEKPESLRAAFTSSAQPADLSLIEGNHGLFDSFDEAGTGSTAAVARALEAPILLVVNAARTGRSLAAIVHGCQTFEPGVQIAGVVLNNIAQGRHESRIRAAVEDHCGIPVVGAIPRNDGLTIPDRHLGLVPRGEGDALLTSITNCRQTIERCLDLDLVLQIAGSASSLPVIIHPQKRQTAARPKIGVMRDRAFTFYYPENLEALEENGAELVFIDALEDSSLPEIDALYIGGGFPEIFMDELSVNADMRQSVHHAAESGLPIHAECGGMMYLARRIRWGEKSAEMVGALPCEIEMTDKPQGHGYVIAEVDEENPFFVKGTVLRGHEFHNSRLAVLEGTQLTTACKLSRGSGLGNGRDGIVMHNIFASYTHLHVGAAKEWAENLVRRAQIFKESRA